MSFHYCLRISQYFYNEIILEFLANLSDLEEKKGLNREYAWKHHNGEETAKIILENIL